MDAAGFAKFAEEIARGAGEIVLKAFRSPDTVVSYKSRTDLVTSADKESERFLFDKIRFHYPDHAIVAEEGSRQETHGEFVWYIDPVDGTNNFAHGVPVFCISIGIYSRTDRRMVAGVVYDPCREELFSAVRGRGSLLNGDPIHVSETRDIGVSLLATGFPYDSAHSKSNNLREFGAFLPRIQGVRRMGSAAIDLAYVACGRFDGFWEPKLKPWDSAAGSIIVEEGGGRISKYDGTAYDPEFPEIIASNSWIHDRMIDIIQNA
jgi:myo-inositol-1(or 4)-monophosphatase